MPVSWFILVRELTYVFVTNWGSGLGTNRLTFITSISRNISFYFKTKKTPSFHAVWVIYKQGHLISPGGSFVVSKTYHVFYMNIPNRWSSEVRQNVEDMFAEYYERGKDDN